MRRDFFEKYSKASKDKPAVLRSVYRYLTDHSFAPENEKEASVDCREHTLMQCLDDKAIISVGEPEKPTTVFSRIHNPGLVSGNNRLLSLDHDFHICGIVPSVCLIVDIPEDAQGSFHHGNVHITVKDKIFEPSDPIRHSAETLKIVRVVNCENDDINSDFPIIIRYTDGGLDHRTTYKSIQFAAILEFLELGLDMFIHCRTAPNQSYNNPAERVMSLLTLGL